MAVQMDLQKENMTTETAKPLNQILATLELPKAAPSMDQAVALSSKDKTWCAKWLKLQTMGIPDLEHLQREAFRFCCGYAKDPKRGRMLVLFGSNGVGKSMVARNMADWAFQVRNNLKKIVPSKFSLKTPDVQFAHWPKFLDDLKNGSWELVDEAESVCLLVLDELGGAYDPSGMGTDKLCRILSHRENKWTVVTTNLTPENWETAFDRRIASRLFRNSTHVEMNHVSDYHVSKPCHNS